MLQIRWRRRLLWSAGLVVCGLLLWLTCGWLTIQWATAPRRVSIPAISTLDGKPVSTVETTTADSVQVSAWHVRQSDRRIVILLAGYGGNRTTSMGLASHYLSRGWSVLLPDLRATGESGGDRIGFGYLERLDVQAWVESVKRLGYAEIALHGQSLGAAAMVYSVAETACDFAFIVLDSCYDDVRNALKHRLRLVPFPDLFLKPVVWFGEMNLHVQVEKLRPIDCVGSITCPVLFVAGDQDSRVLPSETREMYAACKSAHKAICWLQGGSHENLWIRFAKEYGAAIDGFLR